MKVYVEPIGGLCNRMRVIASAYELVKPLGGTVIVKWVANEELNCPSRELFSLPAGIHVVELSNATPAGRLRMKLAYYRLRLGYRNHLTDGDILAGKQTGNLIPQDKTYYETCETFHKDSREVDCSIFRPRPALEAAARKKIQQITQDGAYRVIGLHIRRTDHSLSIRNSPTELFCQVVDAHLRRDPALRFYVATDDASVRKLLSDTYNRQRETVFFNDSRELRRDTPSGIHAALVELLTLSMTQRIYGSCGSSYTDMAAALGKIPLTYVTVDTIHRLLDEIQ